MKLLIWACTLASSVCQAQVPANAVKNIPLMMDQIHKYWPQMPWPASLAAQIQQETCAGIKSKVCWTPNAKLQTSREYGFGWGQTTVSYNADGSERFNAWKDIRKANGAALKDWTWANRVDPVLGMRALVLYDYQIYKVFDKASDTSKDKLSFTYSGYNGGMAGTTKDIRICQATPNCISTRWKSENGKLGVEATSNKSRVKWKGYGLSAYDINRSYVTNVMEKQVGVYNVYINKVFK